MAKIKTELRLLVVFLLLLVVYAILPSMEIDPGWPYNTMPAVAQYVFSSARRWLAAPLAAFTLTLLVMQMLCRLAGPVKKRRGLKIAFGLLAGVLALSVVYWTLGSLFTLSPLPPLPFAWWIFLFGRGSVPLCIWWSVTGIVLYLSIKF